MNSGYDRPTGVSTHLGVSCVLGMGMVAGDTWRWDRPFAGTAVKRFDATPDLMGLPARRPPV